MTEQEVRESIKKDIDVSDDYIDNYCKYNNLSVLEYREWLDRALKARKEPTPKDYPKAIITKNTKDT